MPTKAREHVLIGGPESVDGKIKTFEGGRIYVPTRPEYFIADPIGPLYPVLTRHEYRSERMTFIEGNHISDIYLAVHSDMTLAKAIRKLIVSYVEAADVRTRR